MAKEPVQYFVVDAFTDSAFKGNPAAVCILEEERDDNWLQSVAAEFNLSETAFLIRLANSGSDCTSSRVSLRWFTPVTEVDLCGHATLGASHALFANGFVKSDIIEFETQSGILTARKVPDDDDANDRFLIELNFPAHSTTEFNSNEIAVLSKALNGASTIDIKRTTPDDNILVVLPSGRAVTELKPEMDEIRKCPGQGVIVCGVASPESGFDFYSRYFCPQNGIDEDPVTGSAYCSLGPYWSKMLGKSQLRAYQASARGGILDIVLDEKKQRVLLRGKAVTVMKDTLLV